MLYFKNHSVGSVFFKSSVSLFFFFLLIIIPASAQISWTGGSTGNWNDPTNWSTGEVPTDTADILIETSVDITLDANPVIRSLHIDEPGIHVSLLAGSGNTFIIDSKRDSTLANSSGFYMDDGNFTIGAGVDMTIRNQRIHAYQQDTDTLTNYGSLYIQDYEALGGGGEGMKILGGAVFQNYGTLTVDDTDIVGDNFSFTILLNGGNFHNFSGATLRVATEAMASGSLARDAITVSNFSSFINDGFIHIGNDNTSSVRRYGIYSEESEFINNDSIYISGTTNGGIYVDNPTAVFTNNGGIHIINADEGIIVSGDADRFVNAGNIFIGNGEPNTINNPGIVYYGLFENAGNIHINGTRIQGLAGYNENALFNNTGLITIENTGSEGLRVGNSNPSVFNNDGGLVQIAQNGGTIRGAAGVLVDNNGILNNFNDGIINIDFTNGDGIRCDPDATITNSGVGSEINIGLQGTIEIPTIGDGGNSDDGIVNDGSIYNSNGALLNIRNATGRGIRNVAPGILANQSGAILNIDDTRETAIYNGNGKIINEGAMSELNIGQLTLIGTGNSDDYGIQNDGVFENNDGAIIRIDNIYDAEPIKNGNDTCCDSLINDGGHIFIAQNGINVMTQAAIHCRDSSVFLNLNGGSVLIGNVDNYGILMNPESSLVNSGNITITDYEALTLGTDNGLMLMDASLDNNGTITINDPNNTGYSLSHALNASNCIINNGPDGNIIVIDDSMATGKIGGNGIYFSDCTVTNAGQISVGQGNPAQIGANGIQWFNTSYTSTATGMLEVNGVPVNANAILLSSNSSINNGGSIVINNTHRGINNSSAASGIINSGSITIGDGDPAHIGSHAIYNASDFGNSGTITINGASDNGIRNGYPGMVFVNEESGVINIDNTMSNAFTNGIGTQNSCDMTNSGMINIGLNGTVAKIGLMIDDSGTLANQNNGIITIQNTTGLALQNDALAANGLSNLDCALIDLSGDLYNTGSFLNAAILKITAGGYTYTNDINNTGFIQDGASAFNVIDSLAGTLSGVINSGIRAAEMLVDCSTNVGNVLLSENPDLSTAALSPGSIWYADELLSIPAGDYNAATNTFSYYEIPPGGTSNTLYFEVGNCGFIGKLILNIRDNCATCVDDIVVSGNPENFQLLEALETLTTSGTVIVETGKMVAFKAGESILLEIDFEVQLGGEFEAYIGECGLPAVQKTGGKND